MSNDTKKLLALEQLGHFKDLLATVSLTNNYIDLDGKPFWIGSEQDYQEQKGDILNNTWIIVIPNGGGGVEIVSWADGTEDQIQAMIDAAKAGKINLSDYWNIGDERVIHHSAMAATGVGESHAEQDATWVIMDTGENSGYVFEDDTPVHFVVGMKDSFNENGYMNSTNTNAGSWDGCARRTWCNNVLPGSFPAKTRNFFKPFKTITAETYNSSTLKSSVDKFALFAEKEIFGTRTYSNKTEATALKQIKYYETAVNRIKNVNGAAAIWWERSPYSSGGPYSICYVNTSGSASGSGASNTRGLSPFGCI